LLKKLVREVLAEEAPASDPAPVTTPGAGTGEP